MLIDVSGRLCIIASSFDGVLSDEQIARGDYGARVVFDQRNKIVDQGMQVFSRLLGGGAGAPPPIGGLSFSSLDEISVGVIEVGNVDPAPLPPADDDVTGVQDILYVPQLVVTYPTDTAVKFSGVIPSTEANGALITEEALRLRNNVVFAKISISPGYLKVTGTALQLNHTISFSRA